MGKFSRDKGDVTIEKLSGAQYFNRKPATLKRYCREHSICFPDYVPMHMREKEADSRSPVLEGAE